MISARRLDHINVNVSDIGRSVKFYQEALGLQVKFWEGETMVFLHSPGNDDTITLCKAEPGEPVGGGGVSHFGFRVGAENMDEAVKQIERAGGKALRRGQHDEQHPFVYFTDPDGYVIELS
jgi:catechol 2,3-dioxygenase-like lactoylglutathione lyase family enzyme